MLLKKLVCAYRRQLKCCVGNWDLSTRYDYDYSIRDISHGMAWWMESKDHDAGFLVCRLGQVSQASEGKLLNLSLQSWETRWLDKLILGSSMPFPSPSLLILNFLLITNLLRKCLPNWQNCLHSPILNQSNAIFCKDYSKSLNTTLQWYHFFGPLS